MQANLFVIEKIFDKFDHDKYGVDLLKIEKIFEKYPHLMRKEFFDAPYEVHKDVKGFYPLSFYSSQKGLLTCISYFKLLSQQNPDEQLDYIKESLKFITKFCLEHKLLLNEYVRYKSVAQNDCLKHLKNHQISWYIVMAIPEFRSLIQNMAEDEFNLYFGEEIDINYLINSYGSSKVTRPFLEKKRKEIDLFLLNKLNKR